MIVKVCGMRDRQNIAAITSQDIQMIGLNFYPASSRYIANFEEASIKQIPEHIKRVGVFVNASLDFILNKIDTFKLHYVQLHGDETDDYCQVVHESCPVIKVFRIDEDFDMSTIEQFEHCSDYYLFDTRCKSFGGSGKKFNWEMLEKYEGNKPFLLSGGIGPEDAIELSQFTHDQFVGIDINSKFELAPAVKSKDLIETFLTVLNIQTGEIPS